MSSKKKVENEDDDEEYRDPEDKWSGFHFTRVVCISILILLIMILALALDQLSTWGKLRECSTAECQAGYCPTYNCVANGDTDCDVCRADDDNSNFFQCCVNSAGTSTSSQYGGLPSCRGTGACGWRTGYADWVYGGHPDCPTPPQGVDFTDLTWTSNYNYADLCANDDDEACMAKNRGNVYLVFTIFAIIFNLFAICVIAPLYCRDHSLFPCEWCNGKTHWVLFVLYLCCVICNLIPIIWWLGGGSGGMCDNADPNHQDAFDEETPNFPGYSLGGLMICVIGHLVAACAVCCCWGDNRQYGEERDNAKVQRQKEKEEYRKEQEMTNQNQPPPQQEYNDNNNQPPPQQNYENNPYNNANYGDDNNNNNNNNNNYNNNGNNGNNGNHNYGNNNNNGNNGNNGNQNYGNNNNNNNNNGNNNW